MSENKGQEVKDKVVEQLKATAGKMTNNEKLEAEGKIQKGAGEVREVGYDLTEKAKTVTDKLIGSAKATFDQFSDAKNVD